MAGGFFRDDDDLPEAHEINVTPFIDVMLVLLIIFMVAAPLATVDINVDLPASSAPQAPRPDQPVWVTLKPDLSVAVGTEAVAEDALAAALALVLDRQGRGSFHVSDLLVDRHDLLSEVQRLTGCPHAPPPRAETPVSQMGCARLTALGWRARGWPGLVAALPGMLAPPSSGWT